jgi:hypothetical protein
MAALAFQAPPLEFFDQVHPEPQDGGVQLAVSADVDLSLLELGWVMSAYGSVPAVNFP